MARRARYVVIDASTAKVLEEGASFTGAWSWLQHYRDEVSRTARDLYGELLAAPVGGYVRTHPDNRGVYVRRTA